jgi:hypothetical protein
MALAVTYQVKYDAKFAEFSCQEKHAMTSKTNLQLMIRWIYTAIVVTVWYDQDQETNQGPNLVKRLLRKNMTN